MIQFVIQRMLIRESEPFLILFLNQFGHKDLLDKVFSETLIELLESEVRSSLVRDLHTNDSTKLLIGS